MKGVAQGPVGEDTQAGGGELGANRGEDRAGRREDSKQYE
jgi:hypothetical protein